ncbi:hypothetical protein EVAR_41352_1 [Eumeta japonica]|uniref:Mos1 transposase HTH domain-containing protein n=1 Tax=Eumeta variegata TaxID=151549 RepID=A0A4C1XRX3_EUMVA|nr:hypothetical protein EVAR_41352_1 [Eumeta japonica]
MQSVRVEQNWFKHFQSGNFDVKDELYSGRPVTDKPDLRVLTTFLSMPAELQCHNIDSHNACTHVCSTETSAAPELHSLGLHSGSEWPAPLQ